MTSPTQIVATLVRVMKGGSRLLGAITDVSPTDGDYLDIEFHTDFQSDGGDFVIDPGLASEEVGAYTGLDKWNDRLTGIVRPDPQAHADGAIVWAGTAPYEEKLVDGLVDGDMTQMALGIPIRSEVSTFYNPGAYVSGEDAPVAWMWATDEDDDDPWVQTAPFGAVPQVGADIDTVNISGIVESTPNFDFILDTVTPIGAGDGATPDAPVAAPTIVQGPRIHVIDMRAYTKPTDWLDFEIEVSTNAGGAWTSLGNAGSDVFAHTNLTIGTAYRYRYKVLDSEGNVSSVSAATTDYTAVGVGTSDLVAGSVTATILAATITISNTFQTAASGSRVMFDGSGIRGINSGGATVTNISASTGIATFTGAVFKTAASGSRVELDTSGLRFYNSGGTLKLEAKTSDSSLTLVGDLTSGSNITGATITGGILQTSETGIRVVIDGANDEVAFYNGATKYGTVELDGSGRLMLNHTIEGGTILIEDSIQLLSADVIIDQILSLGSYISMPAGPRLIAGSGAPGGAVSAPAGSLYLRENGSVYVKTSGSGDTGWQTITTS